jgi:hypothetical protein
VSQNNQELSRSVFAAKTDLICADYLFYAGMALLHRYCLMAAASFVTASESVTYNTLGQITDLPAGSTTWPARAALY